jgi:hypothetical protein
MLVLSRRVREKIVFPTLSVTVQVVAAALYGCLAGCAVQAGPANCP